MTTTQFLRMRDFGQIADDEPVRTIIFAFGSSEHEWEEIFVRGRYESILDQETRFRNAMSLARFITPFNPYLPLPTVAAKNWRAERQP